MNKQLGDIPTCQGTGGVKHPHHDRTPMVGQDQSVGEAREGLLRYQCPVCKIETFRKYGHATPPEIPQLPKELAGLLQAITAAFEAATYPTLTADFDGVKLNRPTDDFDDYVAANADRSAVNGCGGEPLLTDEENRIAHLRAELIGWWDRTAASDITGMVNKVVEYGGSGIALDLIEIGQRTAGVAGREASDEEAIELGIAFYLQGKISRWHAAIVEGRRPSDDTLMDIAIYAMMARRNRAVGGWPFPREM